MARPTALTDEVRARVERDLAEGVPVTVAAQNVGVSPRTLHSWLAAGKIVRREPADPLAGSEVDDLAPVVDLDERLAQAEPGLVSVIIAAARRGSWQAALAVLERRFPERWAKQPRPAATGPASPRTARQIEEDDVFAAIDELAERRVARG